jgi:glyoxylase-like metal-dependent hydrolase (beta-lactamase superfamily II)
MTADGTPGRPLPVAPQWFTATEVDEVITRIREQYAVPLAQANIWHVRGRERDLLVDCGLGVVSFHQSLPRFASPEPLLVLTHGHFDHMGSAYEFEQCWSHSLEPVAQPGFGTLNSYLLAKSAMFPAATQWSLPDYLITARPSETYDPDSYEVQPPHVTRKLEEGDQIDLGDRCFAVLHLPGHSPGSIGLYDEHNGILFSGDVIYDGPLIDDIVGCNVEHYIQTMRRLRTLDVRIVHPGHGNDFGQARLKQIADDYITTRMQRTQE